MTAIGDVIEQGQTIPDDVTEFEDSNGRPWKLSASGHWHTSEDAVEACAAGECYEDAAWKMLTRYMPLTVTAVREPEAQTVRVTMALDIDDRDGKAVISTHHLGEIGSCDRRLFLDAIAETFGVVITPQGAESQQVDASTVTVLDLVRQYGQARWNEGTELDGGSAWREARTEADFQFDRIAALVPHGVVPDGAVGDGPCHDCGAVNIRWYADSPIWNHVMGGPESRDDPGGILCVQCFVIRAYAAGYNPSAWRVSLPVRVEMAPPREPRTWPRLDVISADIKAVRGVSGEVYHLSHFAQSIPVFCKHTEGGRPSGPGYPFHALQTFDGPLTEVFDA